LLQEHFRTLTLKSVHFTGFWAGWRQVFVA